MAQKIGHHLWMFNYARVPQLELGFNVQNNPLCTEGIGWERPVVRVFQAFEQGPVSGPPYETFE